MILLFAAALAHHDAGVGRIGGAPLGLDRLAGGVGPPRLELEIGFDRIDLRRTLRGSSPYGAPLGTATSHALTLGAGVTLRSGTTMIAEVPLAQVSTRPTGGERKHLTGLGDVGLHVAQRLGRRADRVGGWLRVGVLAPTGRVSRGPAFQSVDVTGSDDGSLTVTTFDTRASLGTGAFTALGGAGIRVPLGPHGLTADLLAGHPAHRTADGILWGPDLQARLGAIGSVRRWTVGLAGDLRRHGRDDVPGIDDTTGEPTTARLGGRTSAGIEVSAGGRLERAGCRVRGRIPVWQRVGSVQLGETLELGVRCRLDVPLAASGG